MKLPLPVLDPFPVILLEEFVQLGVRGDSLERGGSSLFGHLFCRPYESRPGGAGEGRAHTDATDTQFGEIRDFKAGIGA